MDAWLLTSDALREPWRLWGCHLAYQEWRQALNGGLVLSIPLMLAQKKDRGRVILWLFILAPVLSLAMMPTLHEGAFGGISGLACAAWVLVGLQLLVREESLPIGLTLLALLSLKITVGSMTGSGLVAHDGLWQSMSGSHLYGALLGLTAGVADETFRKLERKARYCAGRSLRRRVTMTH
jgi:hypothetical protein